MMDVHVTETRLSPGRYAYQVWVDGAVYDEFTSAGWLTHADQVDVAEGYREALEGYHGPGRYPPGAAVSPRTRSTCRVGNVPSPA